MIDIKEKSKCCGCHACANICPKHCIEMVYDDEGFLYPKVDKGKCINCGLCEKVCPIINKRVLKNRLKIAKATFNNDLETRMKSSSGGIFSLLAEYILNHNGVVFGASFDKNFKVVHTRIDNVEDIDKLRTSKYVQSAIGDTYKQAKDLLNEGKTVLFTGTPCQIGGLLSYLGKDYPNLYTQDLICHGVPSPKVWEKYIEYREEKANAKVKDVSFRKKFNDKNQTSFYMAFDNGVEYTQYPHSKDPMIKMFLHNNCLRPSCHECAFKGENRQSDITLADFWGVSTIKPSMRSKFGTSLVLIHSKKGKELFENIIDKTKTKNVNYKMSTMFNPMMKKSAKAKDREEFMEDFKNLPFEQVVKKYAE